MDRFTTLRARQRPEPAPKLEPGTPVELRVDLVKPAAVAAFLADELANAGFVAKVGTIDESGEFADFKEQDGGEFVAHNANPQQMAAALRAATERRDGGGS